MATLNHSIVLKRWFSLVRNLTDNASNMRKAFAMSLPRWECENVREENYDLPSTDSDSAAEL